MIDSTAIVVAAVTGIPGWIAAGRMWQREKRLRAQGIRQDMSAASRDAIEGFSVLTENLQKEIERQGKDCDRRVKQVTREAQQRVGQMRLELLREIARLEDEVLENKE